MVAAGLGGSVATCIDSSRTFCTAPTDPDYLESLHNKLGGMKWPAKWPFTAAHMARSDETEDASFYDTPRFVHHIDDRAQESLAKHYHHVFTEGADVLDLCTSWVSHFPSEEIGPKLGTVVGLGMSEAEMKENKRLSRFVVQDLNKTPELPFEDASFDFVVNAVSIDYLVRPLEVCTEIKRVLRPGGTAVMSFSNRCFPSKVVKVWLSVDESTRLAIVGTYLNCAGFDPDTIAAYDITDREDGNDPMYVVCATKD
jgi:hypothetical protein